MFRSVWNVQRGLQRWNQPLEGDRCDALHLPDHGPGQWLTLTDTWSHKVAHFKVTNLLIGFRATSSPGLGTAHLLPQSVWLQCCGLLHAQPWRLQCLQASPHQRQVQLLCNGSAAHPLYRTMRTGTDLETSRRNSIWHFITYFKELPCPAVTTYCWGCIVGLGKDPTLTPSGSVPLCWRRRLQVWRCQRLRPDVSGRHPFRAELEIRGFLS